MQIDPEQFARHYASLSDDALLDINPDDLTEVARERYTAELRKRKLNFDEEADTEAEPGQYDDADPEAEVDPDSVGGDEWREHAICACSFALSQDAASPAVSAAEADAVLTEAGIPSFIDSDPGDPQNGVRGEYRVMIPAELRLLAEAVLDREIFNAGLENDWKSHFEELSDDDLLALNAEELCAGFLDRAARMKKTFTLELAHRGLRR